MHVRLWTQHHCVIGPLCDECAARITEKDSTLLTEIEQWHADRQSQSVAFVERARKAVRGNSQVRYHKITEERLANWWRRLLPVYRKAMRLFLDNPDGKVPTSQIHAALNCKKKLLKIAMASISATIRAAGISPRKMMKREELSQSGIRYSEWWMPPAVRRLLRRAVEIVEAEETMVESVSSESGA